ncbi:MULTISPECIES: phage tail tape measure protein [Paenibacillus]|uniref:phage tail tape measure protein n=1 Tax=Paenibacillus TaxID=44249 RepID=UPI0022B8D086|nr:phage tail tape measure protein [Paenibacillus caseinilyticus]MCZ8520124.1 phage tail tape measure protein [Paenibacillus caseinilyticus]
MSKEYDIAFKLGAELESSFSSAFGKVQSTIERISMVAGAGLAVFETFSASNEYIKGMNQIQAATGASQEQMAEMSEVAEGLYTQNMGEDWNDVAKAVSAVSSVTKLHGEELEETTKNAMLLRDTFEYDIAESVKASDTMMKNFGITSSEAYNLLAQGAQQGLDKSGELLDSANEYTPYFKTLGFTANEMFDTFSAGLDAGAFNLDKVGDAVKEFNIRVKDGNKGTADAFKALGMDAEKMSQTFAAGGPRAKKAFNEVVQAVSKIEDPVKKNQIGVALMGTQFEDLEAAVVAAMGTAESKFDSTKKTMDEIAKVKHNSPGEAFEMIGRQLEVGLLIPLGQLALPVLNEFSWALGNITPIVSELVYAFQNGFDGETVGIFQTMFESFGMGAQEAESAANVVVETLSGLRAAVIELGGDASAGFNQFLSAGQETYAFIVENWSTLEPLLVGVAGAFAAYQVAAGIMYLWSNAAAIGAATTGAFGAAMAFLTSPIFLIAVAIGAVIAAGYALYKNWDTVKAKAGELRDGIHDALGGLGEWFGGLWDAGKASFFGFINSVSSRINGLIRGLNSVQVDIPEGVPIVGGTKFGLSIPEIPMAGYAEGGIIDQPHMAMVGEGGDKEVIVPINNSKRSMALWQTAGNMLGANTGGGGGPAGGIVVHFSPQITLPAGGENVREQVRSGLNESYDDLVKRLQALQLQVRRTSYD